MENIKFPNKKVIKASISFSGNICTIGSEDVPLNTSTIKLLTDDGRVYGIYTDYDTVYRRLPGITQLSNDGSIWVDPIPPGPGPEPEPDPTPSLEERVNDLEVAVCEIADSLA